MWISLIQQKLRPFLLHFCLQIEMFLFFIVIFYHNMSLFLEIVSKTVPIFLFLFDVRLLVSLDENLVNPLIGQINSSLIYHKSWFAFQGVVFFLYKRRKLCSKTYQNFITKIYSYMQRNQLPKYQGKLKKIYAPLKATACNIYHSHRWP